MSSKFFDWQYGCSHETVMQTYSQLKAQMNLVPHKQIKLPEPTDEQRKEIDEAVNFACLCLQFREMRKLAGINDPEPDIWDD